jgi:hypothetical protein
VSGGTRARLEGIRLCPLAHEARAPIGLGDVTDDEFLPTMGDAVLGTVTAQFYSVAVKFNMLDRAKAGSGSMSLEGCSLFFCCREDRPYSRPVS